MVIVSHKLIPPRKIPFFKSNFIASAVVWLNAPYQDQIARRIFPDNFVFIITDSRNDVAKIETHHSISFQVTPQNPHLQYRVRPCVLYTRLHDLPCISASSSRKRWQAVQGFGTNDVTRAFGLMASEAVDPSTGSPLWDSMTLARWFSGGRFLCCLLICIFRSWSNCWPIWIVCRW